jgi:hypothetical protein
MPVASDTNSIISLITLQTPLVKVQPTRKCSTKFWWKFPHEHIPTKHTIQNLGEKLGTRVQKIVFGLMGGKIQKQEPHFSICHRSPLDNYHIRQVYGQVKRQWNYQNFNEGLTHYIMTYGHCRLLHSHTQKRIPYFTLPSTGHHYLHNRHVTHH